MAGIAWTEKFHQPLLSTSWDPGVARREIEAIAAETENAFRPENWWIKHPLDHEPNDGKSEKTVYSGATGIMWALKFLHDKQLVSLKRNYDDLWLKVWEDYQQSPDTDQQVPSWFLGQSAILLMGMLHGPEAIRASFSERLFEVIRANVANPTWEILWGSPGTMLAAIFAFEHTKDPRWLDPYLESGTRLFDEWQYNEALKSHVWIQDLYGTKSILYGAGHGFAGNAFALLRGVHHFSESQRQTILSRITESTLLLANQTEELANWPTGASLEGVPDNKKVLMQWCHGAPGFLLCLANGMPVGRNAGFDNLLLKAGELIWQAGPLVKGACFCHGTDGNGMSLISLFKRTGDEKWLNRARLLAMDAIDQSRLNSEKYGRRRYSLWTGDLGLAIFLEACLSGAPHMPMLDFV